MKRLPWYILSLVFLLSCTPNEPRDTHAAQLPALKSGEAVATFAGGCFWATQEGFDQLKGVRKVVAGYSGGDYKNPTYEQVSTDETGHAEAVQIYYDPKVISYPDLLKAFFAGHDPTTLNRQGPDAGRHYRSVAFYRTAAEKAAIEADIQAINKSGSYSNPVVTEVAPFQAFYPAEVYHQNYCKLHPYQLYIQDVSLPKVHHMEKVMAGKLKSDS